MNFFPQTKTRKGIEPHIDFAGLHGGPGLRARGGSQVSRARRQGGAGLGGQGGPLPRHPLQQGEAHRQEGLHGLQADGLRIRPAQVSKKDSFESAKPRSLSIPSYMGQVSVLRSQDSRNALDSRSMTL